MKKVSLLLLPVVALLVTAAVHSSADIRIPGPFIYGYMDKSGKLAIPCRYLHAMPFSEGLAAVSMAEEDVSSSIEKRRNSEQDSQKKSGEGKWGYIDKTGIQVIPAQFRSAGPFSDGLALVQRPGERELSYIDHNGKVVLTVSHRYAHNFSEGLAVVVGERGRNGYINKSGQTVIEPRFYPLAKPFHEGLAAVEVDKKWGFINKYGEFAIPFQFDEASSFSDGLAAVRLGNTCGYIDRSGGFVIPPQFRQAGSFSEGLAPVKLSSEKTKKLAPFKEWAYINRSGKVAIPPQFMEAEPFSEGLAIVKRMHGTRVLCEVIDRSGKMVWGTRPVIGKYSDGLAPVSGPLLRRAK